MQTLYCTNLTWFQFINQNINICIQICGRRFEFINDFDTIHISTDGTFVLYVLDDGTISYVCNKVRLTGHVVGVVNW